MAPPPPKHQPTYVVSTDSTAGYRVWCQLYGEAAAAACETQLQNQQLFKTNDTIDYFLEEPPEVVDAQSWEGDTSQKRIVSRGECPSDQTVP